MIIENVITWVLYSKKKYFISVEEQKYREKVNVINLELPPHLGGGANVTLGVVLTGATAPGRESQGKLVTFVGFLNVLHHHTAQPPWETPAHCHISQEEQCRFHCGYRTVNQLFSLARILEGSWEFAHSVYVRFLDQDCTLSMILFGQNLQQLLLTIHLKNILMFYYKKV